MMEKKRRYTVQSEEVIAAALAAIRDGESQVAVARRFGISRGTLQNKLKKSHSKNVGRPTVLSEVEESAFVDHIIVMADWGFPVDRTDVRMLVKAFLDKKGAKAPQFKSNYPGEEWVASFVKRHGAKLSVRLCQNIAPKRAAVDPAVMKRYFENLEETLRDVPDENIINYDETNLTDDPGRKKCMFRRGVKYPERIIHHSKAAISVMFAGSASGDLLPVYTVYRAENMWDTWTEGGPPGARYNRSKSGWFDSACFEDWFHTIALPYLKRKEGRKVMIGDNLSSHFSHDILEECQRNNIAFVCLPPNTTHLCQPLDVAFFAPLKRKWRKILNNWKTTGGRRSATVTKDKFPSLLKELLSEIDENASSNLKGGFRKSGIVPVDATAAMKDFQHEEATVEMISTTFIEHLKVQRYGDPATKQAPKKKKNMNAEPGKSVTSVSRASVPPLQRHKVPAEKEVPTTSKAASSIPSGVQKKTAAKKRKARESSDSEDYDSPVFEDSSSGVEDSSESSDSDAKLDAELGHHDQNEVYTKGEFLLIKLEDHIYYVAQVGDEAEISGDEVRNGDDVTVSYMRKSSKMVNSFYFPEVPDVHAVAIADIVCKLPIPLAGITQRLARYIQFPFDFGGRVVR